MCQKNIACYFEVVLPFFIQHGQNSWSLGLGWDLWPWRILVLFGLQRSGGRILPCIPLAARRLTACACACMCIIMGYSFLLDAKLKLVSLNCKWLFKYVRIRNNFFDTWVLSWVYHSHDHLSLGTAGRRLIVIAWSSGPLCDLKQSFSAVSGPTVYYLKALVPGCSLNLPGGTEEEVI